MLIADFPDFFSFEHSATALIGVIFIIVFSFLCSNRSPSILSRLCFYIIFLFKCCSFLFECHFALNIFFFIRDREIILSLLIKLLMNLCSRNLGHFVSSCSVLVPFGLIFLDFHNHLKIFQFLIFPQVVNSLDKRLFSHCNNFLAYVLYHIVFKAFVSVIVFVLTILKFIFFINSIGHISLKIVQQLLILFVDSILFCLNCFNNFVLGFRIIGASIAVTWNICRVVIV